MKIKHLILLPLLLTLTGCNVSLTSEADVSKTVTDLFGREVTYKESDTKRVVCLGAGALRIYSYVGDLSKLVGVEKIDKEPFGVGTALRPYYLANQSYFATLPIVGQGGPMAQAPEYETLLSVDPTMIISIYSSLETNNEMADKLGIPVIGIKQGNSGFFADEFKQSLTLLGSIFHREERATSLINYLDSKKQDLAKLSELETHENAYVGCIGNWGKTNAYGTSLNFPILKYAYVNNVVDSIASEFESKAQVTIDSEKLIALNPTRIYLDGAGYAGFLSDYKVNKDKYDVLDAFKNGEVYLLLPYNAYYSNLEIGLISTYYVAATSYPSEFPNFDIESLANEVTTAFLGKALYSEMKEASTAYGGYHKITSFE